MSLGTILTLVLGLAATAALAAVSWWLWTSDPTWPWTEAPSRPEPTPPRRPPTRSAGPTGPVRALSSSFAATAQPPQEEAREEVAPEPATSLYTKPAPPERTEVLSDGLGLGQREEDAPIPHDDQLKTRPVRRAKRRPPQPPSR